MKEAGDRLPGIEVGNAWELRPQGARTHWIVGEFPTIPADSLRFMSQGDLSLGKSGARATDVAIKWFVHDPEHPREWGTNKPLSEGRVVSLLAGEGEFEITFWRPEEDEKYVVTLDAPGDFVIWGPGLRHFWRPIKKSTIVTVRWKPEQPVAG